MRRRGGGWFKIILYEVTLNLVLNSKKDKGSVLENDLCPPPLLTILYKTTIFSARLKLFMVLGLG